MKRPVLSVFLAISGIVAAQTAADEIVGAELLARKSVPRFDWAGGLRADVRIQVAGRRTLPGRPTIEWDTTADLQWLTETEEDRLLVHRRNHSGWRGQPPPGLVGGVDMLVDLIPTQVVSTEGDFLDVRGVSIARELFAQYVGGRDSLSEENRVLWDHLTTEEGLRAIAMDQWNASIWLWRDSGLEVGESREIRHRTGIPQLGGGILEMVLTLSAEKKEMCAGFETIPRCVEFVMISRPDPEQVVALQQRLLAEAGTGHYVPVEFDLVNEGRFVLERKTLLPHRIVMRRSVTLGQRLFGEQTIERSIEETERSYVFDYKSGSATP